MMYDKSALPGHKMISVMIDDRVWDKIKKIAKKEKLSASQVVRFFIAQGLNHLKEKKG